MMLCARGVAEPRNERDAAVDTNLLTFFVCQGDFKGASDDDDYKGEFRGAGGTHSYLG